MGGCRRLPADLLAFADRGGVHPLRHGTPGFAPPGWALGLLAWVGKLALLALVLAAFESAIAKMRVFRVPEFLGIALLLGLLGAILLFVSTRLA